MKVVETAIPGVLIIEPKVFRDERGMFLELFRDEHLAAAGLPTAFRQDNRSRSIRDVVRGMHYQLRAPQGKLVTVISGSIIDVVADIRMGSPTFGQCIAIPLDADRPSLVWAPPGFAHGFCVTSASAEVFYKCTEVYDQSDDRGILWSDPALAIAWPTSSPLLSPRDLSLPTLANARDAGLLPTFNAG